MTIHEFLNSPRIQQALADQRERRARYKEVDTGHVERGDVRTVPDPRDPTDIRHLCVLRVWNGVALCALTDMDEVFAAKGDILVRGYSTHSSVPYDLVLDGIYHFDLPVSALGGLVGRISLEVIYELLIKEVTALPEEMSTFSHISGPLDIRWKRKMLQISLMRALETSHRVTERRYQ